MRTRRPVTLATASAVALLGAGAVGMRALIVRQAAIARRRIGKPLGEQALDADRVWRRKKHPGDPVELLLLGDSIAAGLGAGHRRDTLGARLAKGVARGAGRPVRLRTAAVVGSETAALAAQLDALPADYRADVAVIVVGGNDVTHRVPASRSAEHLEKVVLTLRDRGVPVVVGTCPDLGTLRAIPQPLRALAARSSRQLAAAQAAAVHRARGRVVALARAVGPVFAERPDEMFSVDRFHPSALGYRRTAEALLPAVLAALEGSRVAVGTCVEEPAGGPPS
ncbi:SGNH/GDSL hydrolase family protein [Microbacterium trichothecenolyticum]|uniref:Lysophospholipase L1-like esterase n=1 Tax=Microbacterium trichothecenolyticum TaxID=69370 RepID=A0ABU0TPW7_MICTR|nr:SGNH/GDSL hydrolase family protein [Microbacterium trichothecenolyticum]MDQ1121685.1 lysophospholipase L1-like esterase [Microbacterium trichothecenolyticum]